MRFRYSCLYIGTAKFCLGLQLFIKEESWTAIFKILVRSLPNSIKDLQDKHEKAFQTLKTRLTSSPILCLPVFHDEIPFVLQTDASDVGVGAVLLQEFEWEGRLPIAYASKKLLPREKNYSTIEKNVWE